MAVTLIQSVIIPQQETFQLYEFQCQMLIQFEDCSFILLNFSFCPALGVLITLFPLVINKIFRKNSKRLWKHVNMQWVRRRTQYEPTWLFEI